MAATFRQGVIVPGVAALHRRQGSGFPAVPTSSPAFNSQEYYNRIMYSRDAMYPFYGNIDPHRHRIYSHGGGGDYYYYRGFNDNSIRDRANSPWVQHEQTLILDGHGESNVATPRHGNNNRFPLRSPPNPSWVQYEVTLILDGHGHGESNVATPRHGDTSMEAMIAKNLKTKSCCNVLAKDDDGVHKICAVCQEDLCRKEEEEIGVLDCRHEYHASCIKNWLVRKNVCPLCNATAVKVD